MREGLILQIFVSSDGNFVVVRESFNRHRIPMNRIVRPTLVLGSLTVYLFVCCRCEIPECDSPNPAEQTYDAAWLRYTTPFKEDGRLPKKCQRYAALSGPTTNSNGTRCAAGEFDVNATETCYGRWVFEDPETTIGTEVRSDETTVARAFAFDSPSDPEA